jgi:hypothetical protein
MLKTGHAGGRVELQLRDAVDHELIGHCLKAGCRDRVSEYVLRPGYGAGRLTVRVLETRRRSRLSRGRSIKRCGHRLTGRWKRYVVL